MQDLHPRTPSLSVSERVACEVSVSMRSELLPWQRRRLKWLALCLGFGQGCGLCFFVGCGSYYANLFSNPRFFIYLCAFFFLPPVAITFSAVAFDGRVNVAFGARASLQCRIYSSGLLVVLLLAGLCRASGPTHLALSGEGAAVYGVGAVLGLAAAVFLSASCAMLGTVDARSVPLIIVGQTAAGIYTNLVAHCVGFVPGCGAWPVRAYWAIASITVLATMLVFTALTYRGGLDYIYDIHERLTTSIIPAEPLAAQTRVRSWEFGGPLTPPIISPVCRRMNVGARACLPRICWSMAICQVLAIAMNMSLTPLANQIAHGDYILQQRLVLTKLLADFVGRIVFFLLMQSAHNEGLPRLGLQEKFVWLVEVFRAPLWVLVYAFRGPSAIGGLAGWTHILDNTSVLLWLVWLPLIALGAFSSSWCFVVAVTAAADKEKPTVNTLMAASIYAGYFVGISVAIIS